MGPFWTSSFLFFFFFSKLLMITKCNPQSPMNIYSYYIKYLTNKLNLLYQYREQIKSTYIKACKTNHHQCLTIYSWYVFSIMSLNKNTMIYYLQSTMISIFLLWYHIPTSLCYEHIDSLWIHRHIGTVNVKAPVWCRDINYTCDVSQSYN